MSDDAVDALETLCETVADPWLPSCSDVVVTRPNFVRCPFYDKPVDENQRCGTARFAKRVQRNRSTAQSRLGDMTVGDIRYCFQQLRSAGKDLNPDMMLYNGQSAGEFALKYLRETSTAMRQRRKKPLSARRGAVGGDEGGGTRVGANHETDQS